MKKYKLQHFKTIQPQFINLFHKIESNNRKECKTNLEGVIRQSSKAVIDWKK